jgi:septum formation topological specificity factor MinE
MEAIQMDNAYNELFADVDRESRRVKQILAEQRMKDEEQRLKQIQVDHIELIDRYMNIIANV